MASAKKSPAKKKAAVKKAPPVRVPKVATPVDRIPRVIEKPTLDDHLAIISRAVFQAGLSWAFIDARWDDYMKAFESFDCRKVATYDDFQIERILESGAIMKSRPKIAATVANARALLELEREFGSVKAYEDSFASYDDARKDAQKRFKYMGDLNVYYWRFRSGAAVPPLEEWLAVQKADHPRIREMVELARKG